MKLTALILAAFAACTVTVAAADDPGPNAHGPDPGPTVIGPGACDTGTANPNVCNLPDPTFDHPQPWHTLVPVPSDYTPLRYDQRGAPVFPTPAATAEPTPEPAPVSTSAPVDEVVAAIARALAGFRL